MFVCIAIYRLICIAPLADEVVQGELPTAREAEGVLFPLCIAPLVDRSKAQVIQGDLGERSLRLRGF